MFNECSLKVNKLVVRTGSVALGLLFKMPQAIDDSDASLLFCFLPRLSDFFVSPAQTNSAF